MRLVVVESPYAGDTERNLFYAKLAMRDCLRRGEAPIASHLLYTQEGILDDNDTYERELGIKSGLAWAMEADCIAFYTDLGWSPGMIAASNHFAVRTIFIEYRTLPEDLSNAFAQWSAQRSPNDRL